MINPKEILAASMAAHAMGQTTSATMSSPFVQSVPSMSVDSAKNASQVMGGVQQVGAQMWQQMSAVKSSIDQQVFVHQDDQRRQKSYDFNPDMSDLRPSDAQGFPKELDNDFFSPFMSK
jgi:hypothetical protein